MIRLEIDGRPHPVGTEALVLGSADDCGVRLTGAGVLPQHALVQAMPDGSVAIRLVTPEATVHVNGVQLGVDPTPVLHGDKITIASQDILVVEAANVGSTQHLNVADLAALTAAPPLPLSGPLMGGRLVCLTDGREYTVGDQGVFFGRDAASDIVVTSGEVSRRHAQILPTIQGYVLNDSSTNGTFVNEERIDGSRVLARADVVRIGGDEFRFYADESQPATPSPPPPVEPQEAAPPAEAKPPLPVGAAARLNNTMMGMPAFNPATLKPAPRPSGVLASLLVRKGSLKGERFPIRVPIVNIGRADYNDIVINHESVSQAHAKLQRRDEVWVLSELGSTNGTMVDGAQVDDEMPLSPGSTIILGEVPLLFDPTEGAEGAETPGTRVVPALGDLPAPPRAKPEAGDPGAQLRQAPRVVASPPRSGRGRWLLVLLAVVAIGAAAFFYLGWR